MHHGPHIPSVNTICQSGCYSYEVWSVRSEVLEMVETDNRPSDARVLMRADSNPVHFSSNASVPRLCADPTNTDYSIELSGSHPTHAVVYTEAAESVRIAVVCSLVDQNAHNVSRYCPSPSSESAARWNVANASSNDGRRSP